MILIDSKDFAHYLQKELNKTIDQHSLQVLEDGSYKNDNKVKESEAAIWKKLVVKALSYVVKLVDFLV